MPYFKNFLQTIPPNLSLRIDNYTPPRAYPSPVILEISGFTCKLLGTLL